MAKDDVDGRVVLGIIILIGAIIVFMKTVVFPFTLIITPLLFIGLVIFLCIEKEESFQQDSATFYLGIAFLVSFGLLFVSYIIGFGIGGTSIGQATTETYYAITGAQQQVADTLNNATYQLIAQTCEVVSVQNCNILKSSAEAGKSLQDLEDIASKFERVQNIANSK